MLNKPNQQILFRREESWDSIKEFYQTVRKLLVTGGRRLYEDIAAEVTLCYKQKRMINDQIKLLLIVTYSREDE